MPAATVVFFLKLTGTPTGVPNEYTKVLYEFMYVYGYAYEDLSVMFSNAVPRMNEMYVWLVF